MVVAKAEEKEPILGMPLLQVGLCAQKFFLRDPTQLLRSNNELITHTAPSGSVAVTHNIYIRAYTHKRLLDPTNITHTRLVEARLASSSSDESIISNSTNNTAISGNDIGASTTTSTATPTVSNDRKSEEIERGSYPTIIQLIKGSLLGGGNYDDVYSTDGSDCNMGIPVPDSPHDQGCAGEDKPQQVSVPTLEGVARAVLREEKKRLDEKQYIMYEVIACSFLLGLLTQDEEGATLLGGLWTAIGRDTMNDIEALKQELRERGGREQLLMFVTGFAGAGKSTAIKIAQKFCYEFCKATSIMWADNTFLFTAYTGSAAAAFGGLTTVKATYIAKQGSTPRLSADEEKAFEGVRILIIDEVSFLKDDELLKLDRTLQRIGNNRQPFGGYSIIFAGDFQQNEPIRMKASQKLWHPTSSRHFENNINCAIILDGLHRFKDDEAYGHILQRLCRGEMTQEDVDKINKRYVGDDGIKLPKQFDGDTCYACGTNKQRNAITAAIFQEHLRQTHPQAGNDDDPPKHTIIIKGLIESVTSSDAKVGMLRQRIIELGDTDVRQGKKLISPHLCCYIGAYFMCNSNDNLKEQGTGNGTQARLVRVKLRDNPISYGCEVWDGRKVWTVCASDVEFAELNTIPEKVIRQGISNSAIYVAKLHNMLVKIGQRLMKYRRRGFDFPDVNINEFRRKRERENTADDPTAAEGAEPVPRSAEGEALCVGAKPKHHSRRTDLVKRVKLLHRNDISSPVFRAKMRLL
eukprot:CAMPEP_0201714666 /NCGR_PEP_ID=MMETSP0593-20130828/1046_1 /ASSEMBLY_ACC=CAM_ASM_000672 /TAXON_ID=267983 /ORGANISM="Skeletonema japonicum, Strain CCMP2506" /LENGTH=747 /DNA_ID=CAMNT_0048203961 /DNA_START=45 /DNA_END=2288 /DNA_ORIENTATION=-